jgi:hypothetical protein
MYYVHPLHPYIHTTHTHTHTHRNVYTYTHTQTQRHTKTHTLYVYVCMYLYAYVCTFLCTYACMYVCIYIYIYIYVCIYIYTCIHAHIHTDIHTDIHTYIHTMRILLPSSGPKRNRKHTMQQKHIANTKNIIKKSTLQNKYTTYYTAPNISPLHTHNKRICLRLKVGMVRFLLLLSQF